MNSCWLKACWLRHLDVALEKYNNCAHGTTRTTPFEESANYKPKNSPSKTNKRHKFHMGDFVRFSDKRNLYSEGLQQFRIENFSKCTKLKKHVQ